MGKEATIEKLVSMHLTAFAEEYRQQSKDSSINELSFDDRLSILVDLEYTTRKNNKLKRLIKYANLDQPNAHVAGVNYATGRKLDKGQIEALATCQYIIDRNNVIIMGATGTGKSYLASALGMEACKRFYTVKYYRVPELLSDLAIARGEGRWRKAIGDIKKLDLLVLDEWMLINMNEYESRDILEVVSARHKRASTIFCSQYSPLGWHSKISETAVADAILDRIVYDSYKIEINNEGNEISMREIYGLQSELK